MRNYQSFIQRVRDKCKEGGYTDTVRCGELARRANEFGGPKITSTNCYTFVQNYRGENRLSTDKIERIALALGYRVELIRDGCVVIEKQCLLDIEARIKTICAQFRTPNASSRRD